MPRSCSLLLCPLVLASCIAFPCAADAQLIYIDLQERVSGLSSLVSKLHDPADVLPTSLDTIIHDRTGT